MSKELSNRQDVIDSRDVIERIEELEGERAELLGAIEAARTARDTASARFVNPPEDLSIVEAQEQILEAQAYLEQMNQDLRDWDESDEANELRALKSLQDEAEGYCPDWKHGATLIREDYFVKYAQQFAEDIGALEDCDHWPATCIDWGKAARELQQDYTSVEFDGVTYWVR